MNHHISGIIHSAIDDARAAVATSILLHNHNYNFWYTGQLLVIISRTILSEDTIFVGDKVATLYSLVDLLEWRTQWVDSMKKILQVVTIDGEDGNNEELKMNKTVLDQAVSYSVYVVYPSHTIIHVLYTC